MNTWRQNIVILLAKVAGVLIGLLFLGYLVYYNLYFTSDALIKYVPKEAVVYTTFRLTPDLEKQELIGKIKEKLQADYGLQIVDFSALNQLVGNNFSLAIIPAEDKLNYLALLDFGLDNDQADKYLQTVQSNNLLARLFVNKLKSKKVLAISDSAQVLDDVQAVFNKQKPALSQKIEVVFNLKKFEPENFSGKAYLDAAYFAEQYSQTDNLSQKLIIAAFANKNLKQIFTGFKFADQQLLISSNEQDNFTENPDQIDIWPADISYALTFTDFSAKMQAGLDSLKQNDLTLYNTLLANKDYLAKLYNFSWENDIMPLLTDQAQIIVTKDNKYLLATTIEPEEVSVQTEKIEKLIKTYIATRYPIEKTKQLPDGTSIRIISRDLEEIQFNEDQVMGVKIKLLNFNNQEFVYILANNHLILANSRQIITELLNNDQKIQAWQNSGKINNFTNFSENAYLNLENQSKLPDYLKIFKTLHFEQNLDNKFRLILE